MTSHFTGTTTPNYFPNSHLGLEHNGWYSSQSGFGLSPCPRVRMRRDYPRYSRPVLSPPRPYRCPFGFPVGICHINGIYQCRRIAGASAAPEILLLLLPPRLQSLRMLDRMLRPSRRREHSCFNVDDTAGRLTLG